MAKATIVLEDDLETGEVQINVDFDPSISNEAPPSHSQSMAVHAVRHLQETYGKSDDEENEQETTDD